MITARSLAAALFAACLWHLTADLPHRIATVEMQAEAFSEGME
jgi:hypothetical protein